MNLSARKEGKQDTGLSEDACHGLYCTVLCTIQEGQRKKGEELLFVEISMLLLFFFCLLKCLSFNWNLICFLVLVKVHVSEHLLHDG